MGWINLKQQRKVKRKFKVQALYLCDYCKNPIPIWEMPVIDPKGGYHPWPDGIRDEQKKLTAREPIITYHDHPCNDELRGKRPMNLEMNDDFKRLRREVRHAVRGVIKKLRDKPIPGYWTKKKLFKRLPKYTPKLIVKALKFLKLHNQIKKKEGGYIPRA